MKKAGARERLRIMQGKGTDSCSSCRDDARITTCSSCGSIYCRECLMDHECERNEPRKDHKCQKR